jgi:hypothetical protein
MILRRCVAVEARLHMQLLPHRSRFRAGPRPFAALGCRKLGNLERSSKSRVCFAQVLISQGFSCPSTAAARDCMR